MGFVLGSLIVRPFLPDVEDNSAVCDEEDDVAEVNNVTEAMLNMTDTAAGIPSLAWPFLIISLVHLLTGVGYCAIIAGGVSMPRFYEAVTTDDTKLEANEEEQEKKAKHPKLTFLLSFFYFSFSCGLEGFFQSQTFTFGICGPHQMAPGKVGPPAFPHCTSCPRLRL
jgi:hypothetical protein